MNCKIGEYKTRILSFDGAFASSFAQPLFVLTDLSKKRDNAHFNSVLFSRGKRMNKFFTEDSKLYITPEEQKMIEYGFKLNRSIGKWDSLSSRIVKSYEIQKNRRHELVSFKTDILLDKFVEYRGIIRENITEKYRSFTNYWPLTQLWNFSIVGAILLGMISMTLIYKFLGPGASAGNILANQNDSSQTVAGASPAEIPQVLGESVVKNTENADEETEYIERIIDNLETKKKEEFENEIRSMVKGYPIEKMIPYIIEKDRIVAAFLVGIAKKESDWGKHVPVLKGQDCYNYWGYRGKRKLMGTGGHTCFNSRKDAIDTVAKRIEWLVKNKKLNTPAKMVIWKCGSACHKDNQTAVKKWISDVNLYFGKLND